MRVFVFLKLYPCIFLRVFVFFQLIKENASRPDVKPPDEAIRGTGFARDVPLLQVQPVQAKTEGERQTAPHRARTPTPQQQNRKHDPSFLLWHVYTSGVAEIYSAQLNTTFDFNFSSRRDPPAITHS
jgi:hypothetical protein